MLALAVVLLYGPFAVSRCLRHFAHEIATSRLAMEEFSGRASSAPLNPCPAVFIHVTLLPAQFFAIAKSQSA
jgi:hypothetical protein